MELSPSRVMVGEVSCIHWQNQPMVVAVNPDHPLAKQESVSVHDLTGESYVTFVSELRIRRRIDRWLRESKVSMNVVHEFDNIENIKRAVEIGSGITILPMSTIQREVEFNSLVAVELNDVDWYRPLGLVHKRHKKLTQAAQHFVQLLQQHYPAFEPNQSNGKEKTAS